VCACACKRFLNFPQALWYFLTSSDILDFPTLLLALVGLLKEFNDFPKAKMPEFNSARNLVGWVCDTMCRPALMMYSDFEPGVVFDKEL